MSDFSGDPRSITGAALIGRRDIALEQRFTAADPASAEPLEPRFSSAGPREVDAACALAEAAFESFSEAEPEVRARFLERAAEEILAIGDALIERAMAETGLPRGRLEGERGRTVGQLRLFAAVLREGDWLHAVIEPALPARAPVPRPDLRRRHVALGPVAVFGASNFPLAFSVGGGDTASAFAAGCPVVVKGHPAHPGTGELVARAIRRASEACGLHEGVFALLPGETNELGAALVGDPRIKAVGFTGSRGGGLALMRIAAGRDEPIPVYAEMSSINPVILFPGALQARAEALAAGFVQSLTAGAGQFCTNPGLVVAIDSPDLERFLAQAATDLAQSSPAQMLTPGIHTNFEAGVAALSAHAAVSEIARGRVGEGLYQARGAMFVTDARSFMADGRLGHEVFGSSSIVVRCRDLPEAADLLSTLEGQLTATLQIEPADAPLAAKLLPILQRKAGRILANGWPTGVDVGRAMVHGGPFPATSDGRSTSVGSLAIERFLRPVCYQDLPETLLPPALRTENPWGLPRYIDAPPTPHKDA